MFLRFLLQCPKTYIPLLYGIYLCVNKQTGNKVSIQKLIKFVVMRVILCLFEHIIVDLVNLNESLVQCLMLLVYMYLSVYNYAYSEAIYNIVLAPFMNIFSQLVSNVDNEFKNHKRKVNLAKVMEQKNGSNEVIKIQPLGVINKFIHNAFHDPLTFTEADKNL